MKDKVTISIVDYNSGNYLVDCLKSLENIKAEADIQVVIVDNASTDDSIERVKKLKFSFPVHFILNQENLGFGKAHNLVLKNLKSEYVLLLNPDTVLEKNTLFPLLEFMKQYPKVGACTGEIILEDGRRDLVAHRGFPTPLASLLYFLGNDSLYHLTNRDFNVPHEVDAITGAFFLTRKSVLNKTGFFDEDYFMYAEDIDLCFRIKQAGFKIMYLPQVKILHHKGISSGLKKHSQNKSTATLETRRRSLNAFYDTMKIFYRKHYQNKYPFFINWMIFTAINAKWWAAKRKLTV